MRRLTLVLLAGLMVGSVAPASAAGPLHVRLEPSVNFIMTGACTFDYQLLDLRVHGNLLDFVDRAGEFRRTIIAGDFVVKVTNLDTEQSLLLNISGQFFITPNPDGSLTIGAHGRNLFYTVDPEPFTVFHRGRAVLIARASGEMLALVFTELNGRSLDICQALGAL